MATGQISGPLLKSNLERNGVNLSVETDLLYIDVNTLRIGIKQNNPQHELDVTGSVNVTEEISADSLLINTIQAKNSDLYLSTPNNANSVKILSTLEASQSVTVNGDFLLPHGEMFTPALTIINPFSYNNDEGTVSINGNLIVHGTTTTINSTNVEIAGKNIIIGAGAPNRSVSDGAGFTIDLGDFDDNATLLYRSADDSFIFNKPLVLNSGIIIEGQTTDLNDITLSGAIYGPPVLLIDPETHGDNTGTVSINGDMIVSGPLTTINNLSVANITSTGDLRGPATFTIDPATHGNNTGTVVIAGDLTVNGPNAVVNDLGVGNITTTGSLIAPASYTITPLTGNASSGLLTVAGNVNITGESLTVGGEIHGPAILTIDPATIGDNTGLVNIKGELSVLNDTSLTNLSVANITSTGYLRGPTNFVIDPAAYGDNTGLVSIAGQLTVLGTTTTVNNLVTNNVTVNGNVSVPSNFSLTPASSGKVTIAGDLLVSGNSLEVAGTLYGPSTFNIDPAVHGDNTGLVNIAGGLTVSGPTTTVNTLNSGNITTTGYLRGPSTFVIDPAIHTVELGLVQIRGELQVDGFNTKVNTLNSGNITTTGYLRGPTNFIIDPATHGNDDGMLSVYGSITAGNDLTVNGANTSVNNLSVVNITSTGYLRGPASFTIDPAAHGDNTGLVNIAGSLTVSGPTTTVNTLNSGNITTTGYLRGPSVFTIDPLTYGDSGGMVIIDGDLQVNGSTISNTSLNVENITTTGRLYGPSTFIIDPETHDDNTGVVNIYGDLTVSGDTTTVKTLFAGNITSTGYLRGPSTFVIDPAAHGDNTGTVVIAGNLQIDGTTTTINSTVVSINDKLIELAVGSANRTVANGAGIQIDLGSDGKANITYNGSDDVFKLDRGLETIGAVRIHDALAQDSIVLKGSGFGNNNYAVTIQPSILSANRSLLLPNADVTLVGGIMVPTTRSLTFSTNNGITGGTTIRNLSANRDWTFGLTGQALAYHNIASPGLVVKTGIGTATSRNLAVSGVGLSVSNEDGVNGNPTVTSNATQANTEHTIVSRGASGNFSAGIISATLNGNASTATKFQTTRSINNVNFDGTDSITITALTPNTLTRGNYLTGANFDGGTATTWNVNATTGNTGNRVVARDISGNFSAGTITATLNGNANTASKLQTARLINDVLFDGEQGITITANTPGALSRGTYLTGDSFNGNTTTWAVDATSEDSPNKVVARDVSGNFSANVITATFSSNNHLIPTLNNTFHLGSSTHRWNTVYGNTFTGVSNTAQYADLAENYIADCQYEAGTVLEFGGDYDVKIASTYNTRKVAGVVSTNPAYLMDSELAGEFIVAIALQGKIPCKVIGIVEKGDMLVASATPGFAIVNNYPLVGTVIGKALENKVDVEPGIITVVVGRD